MGQDHGNDPVGSCCVDAQIGEKGLEPSRRVTLEPKSSASANSATPLWCERWLVGFAPTNVRFTDECVNYFTITTMNIEYHTRGQKVKSP